jgi:hypothetical protein
MRTLFDPDQAPLSKEETAALIESAKVWLRVWKKRALYSTTAFFLSCACVVPFLDGYPLHAYWNSFGKYLVLLSMALLLPFVLCVVVAIQVWIDLRNLRRNRMDWWPG